jgi:hypothetical protein
MAATTQALGLARRDTVGAPSHALDQAFEWQCEPDHVSLT